MARMKRKQYEAAFKARVALEAVKGEKTIAQVASENGVHPNQVRQWKEHLLNVLPGLFSDRRKKTEEERDELEEELYQQIGQLKVENDWLKKISADSVEEKRQLVERDNEEIRVARQCELLNLSKSSFYYSSTVNDDCNLELMRLIDEQFTRAPFHGVRRMTAWLRTQGYEVNPKRVRRLFRRLGFLAIYPSRTIGFSFLGHKLYPYISKYHTVSEARQGLRAYFLFYNAERLHQSLSYRTPHEVYFGGFKASNQAEAGS